jgi:hypothetical protein
MSIALVVLRFAFCMSTTGRHVAHETTKNPIHATCLDRPTQLLTILGLLVEAVLFGMFTSCMMFDQMEVIHSKLTHIDRLKGAHVGGSLQGIVEVFGSSSSPLSQAHRFRWDWLSPFVRVCFPASLQDEVMGFCRKCGGLDTRPPREQESMPLRLDDVV